VTLAAAVKSVFVATHAAQRVGAGAVEAPVGACGGVGDARRGMDGEGLAEGG